MRALATAALVSLALGMTCVDDRPEVETPQRPLCLQRHQDIDGWSHCSQWALSPDGGEYR